MITFLKELQFLFMPHYWVLNHPYNKQVDEFIKYLLDNYEFTNIGDHTATLGNVTIWISNHPYASMTLYGYRYALEKYRPSRLTIKRAKQKLEKAKSGGYSSEVYKELEKLKSNLK